MRCVRFNNDGHASFGFVEGNHVLVLSGSHFGPQQKTGNNISRLPYSIRILLESVLREPEL